MPDFVATGELLIDFISTRKGVTLVEAPAFEKAAGGAPANVAVGLARLGVSSGFMGQVGSDDFGRFLQQTLQENGVDTSRLLYSDLARTALAFVSLRADGERDFIFFRHPSADMLYGPEQVDEEYVGAARVFHFGSIALGAEASRAATLRALQVVRERGVFVSYDPNLRLNLWSSAEAAKEGIMAGWPHANLIKVSEEELLFLSGIADPERAVRSLWHEQLRLVVVTQGAGGALYYTRLKMGHVPGFEVEVADTTGAGDAFLAGLIYRLMPHLNAIEQADVRQAVRFANAVGALTTTRRGAIAALPTLQEVARFLLRAGSL